MTDTAREQGLSPDLIPFISQPNVSMAVVTVVGVRWTRKMDADLQVDSGPVTFRVVSTIHGALRDGQSIDVPAQRVVDPSARARHNFDAWNTLSLTPGNSSFSPRSPARHPSSGGGSPPSGFRAQMRRTSALCAAPTSLRKPAAM